MGDRKVRTKILLIYISQPEYPIRLNNNGITKFKLVSSILVSLPNRSKDLLRISVIAFRVVIGSCK